MKLLLVATLAMIALPLAAPAASAWPPVCLEKDVGALRTNVHVQYSCGVYVEVTHCPPVGPGVCWAVTTEHLLA